MTVPNNTADDLVRDAPILESMRYEREVF